MGGPKSRGRPCYTGEVLWRAEFSFGGTRTNLYWLKGAAAQHPGEGKRAELFFFLQLRHVAEQSDVLSCEEL